MWSPLLRIFPFHFDLSHTCSVTVVNLHISFNLVFVFLFLKCIIKMTAMKSGDYRTCQETKEQVIWNSNSYISHLKEVFNAGFAPALSSDNPGTHSHLIQHLIFSIPAHPSVFSMAGGRNSLFWLDQTKCESNRQLLSSPRIPNLVNNRRLSTLPLK